jgi:hypothetical protein
MTWKDLLAENLAEIHTATKQELDDLRRVINRNIRDAAIAGLSADNKFGLAYEAGLLLAKMAVACAGYRVKGQSAHKTTFAALKMAMGASIAQMASYLDRCRRIRNQVSYDAAGIVSDTEAEELLSAVEDFRQAVEDWITKNHAALRKRP